MSSFRTSDAGAAESAEVVYDSAASAPMMNDNELHARVDQLPKPAINIAATQGDGAGCHAGKDEMR